MKWWVLSIAICILGIDQWLTRSALRQKMRQPFTNLSVRDIAMLSVQRYNDDAATIIQPLGDGWIITSPIKAQANTRLIRKMISELLRLQIVEDIKKLQPNASSKPSEAISLHFETYNKKQISFSVSPIRGIDDHGYMHLNGQPKIVKRFYYPLLNKSFDALRDRSLLHFNLSKLQSLIITQQDPIIKTGPFTFQQNQHVVNLDRLTEYLQMVELTAIKAYARPAVCPGAKPLFRIDADAHSLMFYNCQKKLYVRNPLQNESMHIDSQALRRFVKPQNWFHKRSHK